MNHMNREEMLDWLVEYLDKWEPKLWCDDVEIPKKESSIKSKILAEKVGSEVSKPSHYQLLPEYEVKDVNKALLNKIEESDFDMNLYEAGWYQQAMQYFMRFHAKNGVEDLQKGVQTMQFVLDSMKERE